MLEGSKPGIWPRDSIVLIAAALPVAKPVSAALDRLGNDAGTADRFPPVVRLSCRGLAILGRLSTSGDRIVRVSF